MCFRFDNRKNDFISPRYSVKLTGPVNLKHKDLTAKIEEAA